MASSLIPNMQGNKVLWAGAPSFMSASQTVTLSEPISKQQKGIVLVWSAYDNNSAQNYDYVYHFVPKYHIQNSGSSGQGVDFFFNTLNLAGHKYLYISDTLIRGFASNDSSSSTGGTSKIIYRNNYWVLRAVLGV